MSASASAHGPQHGTVEPIFPSATDSRVSDVLSTTHDWTRTYSGFADKVDEDLHAVPHEPHGSGTIIRMGVLHCMALRCDAMLCCRALKLFWSCLVSIPPHNICQVLFQAAKMLIQKPSTDHLCYSGCIPVPLIHHVCSRALLPRTFQTGLVSISQSQTLPASFS